MRRRDNLIAKGRASPPTSIQRNKRLPALWMRARSLADGALSGDDGLGLRAEEESAGGGGDAMSDSPRGCPPSLVELEQQGAGNDTVGGKAAEINNDAYATGWQRRGVDVVVFRRLERARAGWTRGDRMNSSGRAMEAS